MVKLEIVEGAEATTTGEEDEDILFEACVRGEAMRREARARDFSTDRPANLLDTDLTYRRRA